MPDPATTPYSYDDYRKIRSGDFDVQADELIGKFLVLDYFYESAFEAKTVRAVREAAIGSWFREAEKYRAARWLFSLLDPAGHKLFSLASSKMPRKKILFQNAKFPDLILQARNYCDVGLIVEGKKDRLFAWRNLIGYVSIDDLHELVYCYLKENKTEYLHKLIGRVAGKLRKARPDYIVLRDDYGPLPRAIILAARKLKIPTMVIQHGIYDLSFRLCNDIAADYALFWGQYFKDLYVGQNARESESIFILGYPYKLSVPMPKATSKRKHVCYLGQDFERYQKELLSVKLESLKKLAGICRALGWDFTYRPHPGDDRHILQSLLPGVMFTAPGEPLVRSITRADILVSFSSTALIEAAMRSKISLQLMNYPIQSDNFEELGACTKSFGNIQEIQSYLQNLKDGEIIGGNGFNNEYIETRFDPGIRLAEIISRLEDKKT